MLDVIAEDEGSLQAILYINNKRSSTKTFKAGSGNNRFLLDFEIENPRLWWTNGLGEPYLYDLRIQLMQENNILHEKKHRLGVRTLELVQEQDNIGESFYFKLNGIPVFMKGADYVPSDILTPRVSDEIYKNLIRTVVESNMNMLRICGCSIYEKDIFYDLCDENGILVWQDFMFANMMSPPQPEHLENIRKEAEDNIIRIRNHPCLALWCGNNEIKVGWNNWNWKKQYGYSAKDSAELWNTYEQIFHGILPLAIAEYDPDRFYHPTSPPIFYHETSGRLSGDQHDWGVWFDELPIESYSVTIGRFVSEYGMQSYPSLKTIKTFAGSADLDMNSPVMRLRQKCKMDNVRPGFDGNDMIMRYIVNYYKAPKDFGSMVYLSQLIQAESVKNAISAHRRNMPRCMGSLYWQINDCWPAISWASLDYFQDWKASQFAVRDKFAPVIPSLVKGNDKKIQLYVISDRLDTIQGVIVLSLTDFNGKELWTMEQKKDIKPNGSELVFEDIKLHGHDLDSSSSCLIARIYTGEVLLAEDFFYFRLPKDLNLTKPVIYKEIRKVENGYEITVSGDRLIKNIYLELPEKQGKFSDNFFDLPKGMRKKIHLMTKDPGLDIEDVKIMSLADTY
jgi:beta-mannosidase